MLLDKITDDIFRAKEILEANLRYKQSLTSGIIKSIAMSQTYIERANEEIKQTDYFNQHTHTLGFPHAAHALSPSK